MAATAGVWADQEARGAPALAASTSCRDPSLTSAASPVVPTMPADGNGVAARSGRRFRPGFHAEVGTGFLTRLSCSVYCSKCRTRTSLFCMFYRSAAILSTAGRLEEWSMLVLPRPRGCSLWR